MKYILSLIFVMIAVVFPVIAQESNGNSSSSKHVELEFRRHQNTPTILRAPMRLDVEVYYYEEDGTLEVSCNSETEGEVFLYLNNNVIGYNSEINSSFQLSAPGLYTIEIVGETWVATGHLQL